MITLMGDYAPVRKVYNSFFFGQLSLEIAGVLLFVLGIFLAEEFVGLLKIATKQLGFIDPLPWLVAYTAPEILDLALPLALVIATYRVLLRLREQRELIVLASAGVSAMFLLKRVTVVAVVATGLSIWISGSVEPQAKHAYRQLLFEAQYEVLRGKVVPEKFYSFNDLFIHAKGRDTNGDAQRIFLLDNRQPLEEQVVTAHTSDLEGPERDGRYRLSLHGFRLHYVPDEDVRLASAGAMLPGHGKADSLLIAEADAASRGPMLRTVRAGQYNKALEIDGFLELESRARFLHEWHTLELLGLMQPPGPITQAHLVEAGKRIARSFLCILAPFLAMVAVGATRKETRSFALPAACAAMMVCDVSMALSAKLFAKFDGGEFLWALTASALILGASITVVRALVRQEGLLRPKLERA